MSNTHLWSRLAILLGCSFHDTALHIRKLTGNRLSVSISRLTLIALIAAALLSVLAGASNALEGSKDLQWSPVVWLYWGTDPYQLALSTGRRFFLLTQMPNYLHSLYLLLLPLAMMKFSTAKAVWLCCNLALSILAIWGLQRHFNLRKEPVVLSSLLFLASSPFRETLGNGQQALLATAAFILSWHSTGLRKGIFLFFATMKYSMAPVLYLYYLFTKSWGAIALAGLFCLISALVFAAITNQTDILRVIFEPFEMSGIGMASGFADLYSVLYYDLHIPFLPTAIISISISALVVFVCLKAVANEQEQMVVVSLSTLAFFLHLSYDYVLMLPFLFYLITEFARIPFIPRMLYACTIFYFFFLFRILYHFDEPDLLLWKVIGLLLLLTSIVALILTAAPKSLPAEADNAGEEKFSDTPTPTILP